MNNKGDYKKALEQGLLHWYILYDIHTYFYINHNFSQTTQKSYFTEKILKKLEN